MLQLLLKNNVFQFIIGFFSNSNKNDSLINSFFLIIF